jgi:hypothetical protein
LENSAKRIEPKTANGIAHPGSPSERSASSAPTPPKTSAIPTMPLTASVSTAHPTKTKPERYATSLRRVIR